MALAFGGRDASSALVRITNMWHKTAVPSPYARGHSLSVRLLNQSLQIGRITSKGSGGMATSGAPDGTLIDKSGQRPKDTEKVPSQGSEHDSTKESPPVAEVTTHFHEATHQATHRVTEKVGFAVMERLVDRILGRTGRVGGERGAERAAERAAIKLGERAAERLGERTAERVTEKAAEQLGEKVLSHAVAQAAQKAARTGVQASLQRLSESKSIQIAGKSAEQILSRVGEQEARLAERGAGRLMERIGSTLQGHVWTRLSERLILRFARGIAIALPALGSLFVMHLVKEDRRRALEEAASGNSITASRAFWLAFLCDAADVGAHVVIILGLLYNHFNIGVCMPHHLLHFAETGGIIAAVVSTVAAILGEVFASGVLKHRKAFGRR